MARQPTGNFSETLLEQCQQAIRSARRVGWGRDRIFPLPDSGPFSALPIDERSLIRQLWTTALLGGLLYHLSTAALKDFDYCHSQLLLLQEQGRTTQHVALAAITTRLPRMPDDFFPRHSTALNRAYARRFGVVNDAVILAAALR